MIADWNFWVFGILLLVGIRDGCRIGNRGGVVLHSNRDCFSRLDRMRDDLVGLWRIDTATLGISEGQPNTRSNHLDENKSISDE